MTLFPAEVIDYYRKVSSKGTDIEGSLVSNINAINLPAINDKAMNIKLQNVMQNKIDFNKGGIDFNADKMNLQTRNEGGEIKFTMDPAMLEQLKNAPGFVPVIINIQPMKDLPEFLGIAEKTGNSNGVG